MYILYWLLLVFEANWRNRQRPVVYHDDFDDDPEMWGDGFV